MGYQGGIATVQAQKESFESRALLVHAGACFTCAHQELLTTQNPPSYTACSRSVASEGSHARNHSYSILTMAASLFDFPDMVCRRDPSCGASCFLKGERLVSLAHSIPGHILPLPIRPALRASIKFETAATA